MLSFVAARASLRGVNTHVFRTSTISRANALTNTPTVTRTLHASAVTRIATTETTSGANAVDKIPRARAKKAEGDKDTSAAGGIKAKAKGTTTLKKPATKVSSKPKSKPKPKPKKVLRPPKPTLVKEDLPPKKPMTSYFLFLEKYRAGQGKDMPSTEICKSAGLVWKTMTDHEKQAFEDESRIARANYVASREEWEKNITPERLQALNKALKARGKSRIHPVSDKFAKVKRPTPSFFQFLKDWRENNPNVAKGEYRSVTQASTAAAAKAYNELSDSERKKYTDAYKEALQAFHNTTSVSKAETSV